MIAGEGEAAIRRQSRKYLMKTLARLIRPTFRLRSCDPISRNLLTD